MNVVGSITNVSLMEIGGTEVPYGGRASCLMFSVRTGATHHRYYSEVKELNMAGDLLTFEQIFRNLDGLAALATAQAEGTRKRRGEYDTEFVKRIVARYVHYMQGVDIVRTGGVNQQSPNTEK